MKPFTITKPYLLSQKYILAVYTTIILISAAISILSPFIIGDFLDTLIAGADIRVILYFCATFASINLLRIATGYITAIMYVKMQIKMNYNFNRDVIEHMQGLSLSYINKNDSAYLSQRVNQDTGSLVTFCVSVLQNVVINVVMFAVPFVVLLTMHSLMALLMMSFVVLYAILYIAFMKPLYKAGFAFKEAQAKFFSRLMEQLKHVKLIKIDSVQKKMIKRADEGYDTARSAAIGSQSINYFYSSMDGTISTIAQIALFVIGGIQILAGNFTIGMFTIFISYFNMMLGASKYFFGLGASYQQTLVSYNRIKEILARTKENNGEKKINTVDIIKLRNINFTYDPNSENKSSDAVINFSANFQKGKIYAITGANGIGKSTIINLMIGMYIDEYEGSITYNNTDIRQIDMVDVRKRLFGFSEQEPLLISDSIRYNLGLGGVISEPSTANANKDRHHLLSATLSEYVDILNMQDFIDKNSLDFEINENSSNISGGEKQKISILKVLHKNPTVMIFDEPTSALDADTAEKFINHLKKVRKNKIIIIITHDEIITKKCDEIVGIGGCNLAHKILYNE